MANGRIYLILLVLVTFCFSSLTRGQATSVTQQQANAAAAAEAAKAEQLNQMRKALLSALGTMIPGGIDENTPREQAFLNVIEVFRSGKIKESMEELKKMATADSELPPAELMMAGLSFAVSDNSSGIAILEKSSIDYPDHPSVFLSFAQLALNESRVTDAQVQLEKSAVLINSGKFSTTQVNFFQGKYFEILAGVQMRRRQYPEAKATLAKLQTTSPDRPTYFLSNAELAFKENGDYETALENLKRFAQTTGQKKKPILTMVEWMEQSGKRDDAAKWLDTAVRKYPSDPEVQLVAARFAMSQEDFQSASISIRNYEKVKGETFATKDMKGRIAFAKQSYVDAASHFLVLNEKQPKDINYANMYALCLAESDDVEQHKRAKFISQKVAQTVPDSALALTTLGYIHLRMNEMEQAGALISRVSQAKSVSPEVSYIVARFLYETGNAGEADKVLVQAMKTKGLFMYRSAAQQLQNKIRASSGGLPARK